MGLQRGWAPAVRWATVLLIAVTLLAQASQPARASDARAELDKAMNTQKYLSEQKKQATNELARVYWESQEIEQQLKQVEYDLAVANSRMTLLNNDLVEARRVLEQVESQVAESQERYDQRLTALGMRIRAISEEGRVNYLAVLLGSTTFTDFISRFDMLKLVVNHDSQLFGQIRADKQALESRQAEFVDYNNWLQKLRAEADQHRVQVEEQRNHRQVVARNLESSRRGLVAQLAEYDRQEARVAEEIAEIQRLLARQAGRFLPIYPLKGNYWISSRFGGRISPITGTYIPHNGTDFAANPGEPIYAVENGQVIVARWDDVYGYLTIIDHGGGISTWYAHASRLFTTVGTEVSRGDRIALVGSTGWSTGPHLHFEIRKNGKPEDALSFY